MDTVLLKQFIEMGATGILFLVIVGLGWLNYKKDEALFRFIREEVELRQKTCDLLEEVRRDLQEIGGGNND